MNLTINRIESELIREEKVDEVKQEAKKPEPLKQGKLSRIEELKLKLA